MLAYPSKYIDSISFQHLMLVCRNWKTYAIIDGEAFEQSYPMKGFTRKIAVSRSSIVEFNGPQALEQAFRHVQAVNISCFCGIRYHWYKCFEGPSFKSTWPDVWLLDPEVWIDRQGEGWEIQAKTSYLLELFLQQVGEVQIQGLNQVSKRVQFEGVKNRSQYLSAVHEIQKHIQRGDVYEINFCNRFDANLTEDFDALNLFEQIHLISAAPFSACFKTVDRCFVSASPERFAAYNGETLWSQPIKGTAARNPDAVVDHQNALKLLNSEKELSENRMVVDLVRNDLSIHKDVHEVWVRENCKLYSFHSVHQLISTICARYKTKPPIWEVIAQIFPMGSMTGAPKPSALHLIEHFEAFDREMFSGAFGWIAPDETFDLNVLIRTLFANFETNRLSIYAGSAITSESEPEAEYDECLLKLESVVQWLNAKRHDFSV